MSLRSPLGQVLGLGTARDGTEHWWAQRVSAVALALLGPWFAALLVLADHLSHAVVIDLVGRPLNAVLLSLFCATVAYHSYLGLKVIIEDYVHTSGVKIALLISMRFAHVFVAITSVYAILRIGIGT